MSRRLRHLALVAALALASPAPALAAPAMWRISDGDSQVFLFGSMHILPGRTAWRTPAFNKALKGAALVYFETQLDAPQKDVLAIYDKLGLNHDGRILSDYLTRAQRQRLDVVIGALGLNRGAIEAMRPWFAALTLGELGSVGAARGVAGVEDSLAREIPNRKERGLDSYEVQVHALADMSDKAQVTMLMETLGGGRPQPSAADDAARIAKAWLGGDVEGLYRILAREFGKPGTERYNRLLTNRNQRWAGEIGRLLAGDKDVMVIVGAGHFAGPTGLPQLLARKGLKVERVQ